MTSKVIKPPKLEFFLHQLNKKFGKFLVLRGYESLPTGYSNDIDVFVPKDDLTRFFYCLHNLDGLETKLTILISRLGLIKCELIVDGVIIPFDILYGFYYFGLEYQDNDRLVRNSSPHHTGLFYTPDLGDEIRISLLKELLHNKRVRIDKASYLLKMMKKCSSQLPAEYLSIENVKFLQESITENRLYLPRISLTLKMKLIKYNFSKHFFATVKNIMMFAAIKYIFKNYFHQRMIK
jgi:hypothetical protein